MAMILKDAVHRRAKSAEQFAYLLRSTTATLFTPLHAQEPPPIWSCHHIADHTTTGWDRLRTEMLGFRIELN